MRKEKREKKEDGRGREEKGTREKRKQLGDQCSDKPEIQELL